jgi:fucose permease
MPQIQNRHARLLVAISYLVFLAIGLYAGLMGVLWPSMRDGFGIDDDAYGVLAGATTVGSLVVIANVGRLIERVGTGRLLALGCALGGLGYLGAALAPSWPLLIALAVVASLGTATVIPNLNTYFALHQSAGRTTWLNACFGLGATISPALLSVLLGAGGSWRWGFGAIGGVYLALAAVFWLTARRWPQPVPAEADGGAQDPGARRRPTLALPAVWFSVLLFCTFTGYETSAGQWSYTFFTEGHGIPPEVAGRWASAFWASMTVGRVLLGWVVDRLPVEPLVRSCMLGAALGAAVFWWAPQPWVGLAGLIGIGLCLSPLFPVLTSATPQRLGKTHTPDALGYQMTAVRLGLAAFPALGGVLVARVGVFSLGPFLLATAILVVILNELTAWSATVPP